MIRFLYRRPLDTLLATWGLSLIMQQAFRSIFGAREVTPTLPEWLMGSFKPTETIDIPINGVFVMGLSLVLTAGVAFFLFRTRTGLHMRATVQNRSMSGAVGINTELVDRFTFALGCGIAGVAGAAFTTIGSTGPDSGSRYIVDTFLVVVFGGAGSIFGTIVSSFGIAQGQSISEFFLEGTMGKVATLIGHRGDPDDPPQGPLPEQGARISAELIPSLPHEKNLRKLDRRAAGRDRPPLPRRPAAASSCR